MNVRYSYLKEQFANCDDLWVKLRKFVATGDFTLGKPLVEFEKKFAKKVKRKYAVAVSNGTAALQLAYESLSLKKGDEVIIPAFTIISCILPVIRSKATPVLVDSNINTWNIKIWRFNNCTRRITNNNITIFLD